MHTLLVSLKESDAAILKTIARAWSIDITRKETPEIASRLEETMLLPDRAEGMWEKLTDAQRGILQTVIGSQGKMPVQMFQSMFGEFRKMGMGQIEREKPLENPKSDAEALFYRGLLFEGYEQGKTGTRTMIYVAKDFLPVLPTHKTGYANLEVDSEPEVFHEEAEPIEEIDAEALEGIQPADTTIVDDMTTLLAYLQTANPEIEGESLKADTIHRVRVHLIHNDEKRLAFMFHVGISAELIEIQNGKAFPRRAEGRRWLEMKRSAQLKALADAWRVSPVYKDLWHVPGLHPEPAGSPYDPVVARNAVLNFMRDIVPHQAWWSVEDFIMAIKESEPDFQRPGGDYDSWYIRNDANEYLHGFESWDAIEGSVIEFYLDGPMHWLGLVDLAEDAARLTAYGRSFVNAEGWAQPQEQEDKITVQEDGTLLVSRKVSRFDRFQAMRFTSWVSADVNGYVYKLNVEGIRRAGEQGINTGHIAAFVQRMLDNAPLPPAIARLLETWQAGSSAQVTMESLLVLRTTAPETLDYIANTPALRRYLGARLGPMAVIIRADEWEALRDALGEQGIEVDILE